MTRAVAMRVLCMVCSPLGPAGGSPAPASEERGARPKVRWPAKISPGLLPGLPELLGPRLQCQRHRVEPLLHPAAAVLHDECGERPAEGIGRPVATGLQAGLLDVLV